MFGRLDNASKGAYRTRAPSVSRKRLLLLKLLNGIRIFFFFYELRLIERVKADKWSLKFHEFQTIG